MAIAMVFTPLWCKLYKEYKAKQEVPVFIIDTSKLPTVETLQSKQHITNLKLSTDLLEPEYQMLVRHLIYIFDLDIDEFFIYGMMSVESSFNHNSVSNKGAIGLLQVMPSTFEYISTKLKVDYPLLYQNLSSNPSDKKSNIIIGVYYLRYLQDYYNYDSLSSNSHMVLTAYNMGTSGARRYVQTNRCYISPYSKKVLEASNHIRQKGSS